MRLNIKERCQKVLQCWREKKQQSIRAIAKATGIPKSSVHRPQVPMARRQQHAESYLWETVEGENWLRLLVFGAIYCFGIKGGIGAESLSAFFHLLHLEQRIGCSASALRELEVQVKAQIVAYGEAQSESCQGEQPIGICVGADETLRVRSRLRRETLLQRCLTFFELPILVAVEKHEWLYLE